MRSSVESVVGKFGVTDRNRLGARPRRTALVALKTKIVVAGNPASSARIAFGAHILGLAALRTTPNLRASRRKSKQCNGESSAVRALKNLVLLAAQTAGPYLDATSVMAGESNGVLSAAEALSFVHRIRVATPNDPKLSDSGARRGSCEGGAKKEATEVEQRPARTRRLGT